MSAESNILNQQVLKIISNISKENLFTALEALGRNSMLLVSNFLHLANTSTDVTQEHLGIK
jgi:hypothetical protein